MNNETNPPNVTEYEDKGKVFKIIGILLIVFQVISIILLSCTNLTLFDEELDDQLGAHYGLIARQGKDIAGTGGFRLKYIELAANKGFEKLKRSFAAEENSGYEIYYTALDYAVAYAKATCEPFGVFILDLTTFITYMLPGIAGVALVIIGKKKSE